MEEKKRTPEEIENFQKAFRSMQQILNALSRNSACPCGSKKKFKKCCLVHKSHRRFV